MDSCPHYKRKAMLLAPCCTEWFPCRFCHDKVKNDDEKDVKKAHSMDRKAVKRVRCRLCSLEQDAHQVCEGCGIVMGAYWCAVCVLLDDEDKGQYHCDKCGICRVGGASEHTHCDKCGICVKTAVLEAHNCLTNAALVDCTVCLESLHTSRESTQFLPCGHGIHSHCFSSFLTSGQTSCPLCKKSVLNESYQQRMIEYLDHEIDSTPMPDEYRKKCVRVLCNDCLQESETLFHIIGLKCMSDTCIGSYNTAKIGEASDLDTDSD
jgi:RING finger/CHY zinc finger protein 1